MSSPAPSLHTIAARLRSSTWLDNDLANALAVGLSLVARQNTFNRGLHDNVIADRNGGTTLAVGDPSAARQSVSLQHPQRMYYVKHGAVATRQQARAELATRTVPAVVLGTSGEGVDATVDVALVATRPKLYTDTLSNQLIPGDPISDAYANPADLSGGDVRTITLSGEPFQEDTAAGPEKPKRGQTIMVSLAEEYEKRTIWVNRDRRNYPKVIERPVASSTAAVNGLCCHREGDPPGS